jgi:pimeloyl-ACP methyl ester carboxylesterase
MQKKIRYGSANIVYRVEGKGVPVVLLHGFGEDSHIWDEQISFLKEHCLLIVPDIPGSGESSLLHPGSAKLNPGLHSDKPAQRSGLRTHGITISDYADAIHALLQHENISCCCMLGHSMGGYITLAFAEKYPAMLGSLGLINSTAFADSEEKKKTRARAIDTIAAYGAHAFLKTTIPTLFGKRFKEMQEEKVNALIAAGAGFTKEALQQYYRAMMERPDRTHVLKSNLRAVLFVTGTEDAAVPMQDVLQQTHLPDKSYIHVLQNVGHMSMWEATEELNRHLLAFINPQ